MSTRVSLRRPRRKVCAGDLADRVVVQDRSITPPTGGSVDFGEAFDQQSVKWAKVRTVSGSTFFNGVNQRDVALTHEVTIRYDSGVTAQSWVLLEDGSLLDVEDVEDLEERHEYQVLRCTERGPKSKLAAQV